MMSRLEFVLVVLFLLCLLICYSSLLLLAFGIPELPIELSILEGELAWLMNAN